MMAYISWKGISTKRVVLKNHTTAAVNVTAELNIHIEDPFLTQK
jgi:hypothetical protein